MPLKNAIKKISALEILDSRGVPTISVTVEVACGVRASASVPSGTSAGRNEAFELRDGDSSRYGGKGVLKAVQNVEKVIFARLKGKPVTVQQKLDELMISLDGTSNKSRLGANAIVGVSLACARAAAVYLKMPLYAYLRKTYKLDFKNYVLPTLMFNLLNGGQHADSGMDIQEFLVIFKNRSIAEAVRFAAQTFSQLNRLLALKKLETGVGLEGGFAPKLRNSKEAIEILLEAAKLAFVPKDAVGLGLDIAVSGLYEEGKDRRYVFKREKANFSREQLIGWYAELARNYPLVSIEDGLEENDWAGWTLLNQRLGDKMMVVGDDLTATSPARLVKAIKKRCLNAIIVKPNQVGTLTEAVETVVLAKQNDIKTVISHRSGDTEDSFIADLAVAVNADYVKAGSVSRGERLAKYNRLLEIEKELG